MPYVHERQQLAEINEPDPQERTNQRPCAQCRAAKVKCSRSSPECHRCLKLGLTCQMPSVPNPRRPRREADASPVDEPGAKRAQYDTPSATDESTAQQKYLSSIDEDAATRWLLTPRLPVARVASSVRGA
eukprot:CAMPEP_0206173350 /NCGR_PEP_ID=MMETSP1474-20131121/48613_1 /ASSEMBLY_ACC=CAM_ASM_001110 /TAXON_ID=97495 /ORGANISM="Imantonia sp., Strain RCC918" /LENGTH=129 /DNA_ID=CAMNT_0053582139 /DNA_START=56 /DNA_END=445 /DNA_ORIENTATION=+